MNKVLISILTILLLPNPIFSQWPQIADTKSITITLPKTTFKEYEPVIALFTIINNGKDTLSIYDIFDPLIDEANLEITDEKGNIYTGNKTIVNFLTAKQEPTFKILSKDTLKVSMAINNWGERYRYTIGVESCFNKFGYFTTGRKYKVKLIIDKNNLEFKGDYFQSNEAEFEVAQLSNEDQSIIDLSSKEISTELLNNLPENALTEHIAAYRLSKYWEFMLNDKMDSDSLIHDYESFIKNYPQSYYLYDIRFLTPYFMKLTNRNSSAMSYGILSNKSDLKGSSIINSISYKAMVNGITRKIERYEEDRNYFEK